MSNFDTSNVIDFEFMFGQRRSLKTLDVSNFDTSKGTDFSAMFLSCEELEELDVSNFDTSAAVDMQFMFSACSKLKEVDLSGFDTSNVKKMLYMFQACISMETIDISNFETANVENMNGMFVYCKFDTMDISMLQMDKTIYVNNMFSNTPNLKTVYLPNTLKTIGSYMFYGSTSLTSLYMPESVESIGERVFSEQEGEGPVISCYEDSYTYKWAVENGLSCNLIDHEHTYNETIKREAPCEGKGLMGHSCTHAGCEAYYSSIYWGEHKPVTDKAVEPTCSKSGLTQGSHCKGCGMIFVAQEEIAKKPHNYQEKVVKAKINKAGSIRTVCAVCGHKSGSETIINAVKAVKLSATSYTYNGKKHKPSVTVTDTEGKKLKLNTDYSVKYSGDCKNPGKYTVTVTFKGNYTGTKKLTYTIKPKAVSVSKLTAKEKGFKVTWKKGSKISGYEIQYSTSSKFSNKKTKSIIIKESKTTSKTISKLKAKKKYYVRIRTYKTVKIDGKSTKVYSSWSKVKQVTTKK